MMENLYLKPGTVLQGGKYRIVRFISSGGFGCTYEAVHTSFNSRVAIKEFFVRDFCNRDEATSRISVAADSKRDLVAHLKKKFIDEATAIFKMHHENIVRVIDIFEENGTAYYVMDYIDGLSLHEIVKQRGALPENEAIGYILQICSALDYVHSKNRLHLDIKPGNIMIDDSGRAILIDFGASKQYDEYSGENLSRLMGINTTGYAPVEQSTQSFTTFSPPTDIYALGATLYKLLSGITPPDSIALSGGETMLQPLPNSVSPNTRRVVAHAMAIRRVDRYQSVMQFANALKSGEAINNEENTVLDSQRGTEQLQYTPSPKPKSNNGVIIFLISLIAVVVIVIAVFVFREYSGKDTEAYPSQNETELPLDSAESVPADTAVVSEPEQKSTVTEISRPKVENENVTEKEQVSDGSISSGYYLGNMAGFPMSINLKPSSDGSSFSGTYKNIKYKTSFGLSGSYDGSQLTLSGGSGSNAITFYLVPDGNGGLSGRCVSSGGNDLSVSLQLQ